MDTLKVLNQRYTLLAWSAIFIWVGAISFVPGTNTPIGIGLMGIGVILLGMNLLRYLSAKLSPNGFDLVLGVSAFVLGTAELLHSPLLLQGGLIGVGVILLIWAATRKSNQPYTPQS